MDEVFKLIERLENGDHSNMEEVIETLRKQIMAIEMREDEIDCLESLVNEKCEMLDKIVEIIEDHII